jgi:hypothetical protein
VRAGVARLDVAEKSARPLPPLARLRERLAAAFGAFAPRAAFAPALALVVFGVAAGALWLARQPGPGGAPQLAQVPSAPERTETAESQPSAPPVTPAVNGGETVEPGRVATVQPPTAGDGRAETRIDHKAGASAPAPGRPAPAGANTSPAPPAANHLEAAEAELLLAAQPVTPEGPDVVLATATTRLPTPEEKEMTRHLEQAQSLLRSFQNEAGGDAVQITYERRLSRKLLAENVTLQLEAEASGNKQTRQVLDTLEPFLLDIANLRDNASRDEVRSIKERMQKTEIIAALHVY